MDNGDRDPKDSKRGPNTQRKSMGMSCPVGEMEYPGESDEIEANVQQIQKYCCAHRNASENRKFRLTFENTSLDPNESCAKQARQICLRFWNFVDSDPKLSTLLKEGQFVHNNQPKEVVVDDDSKRECKDEDMLQRFGMTNAQFQAIHNGNRQRLQKRREMNAALELKSGQDRSSFLNPKTKENRIVDVNKLADDVFPDDIVEALQEMNRFDLSIY